MYSAYPLYRDNMPSDYLHLSPPIEVSGVLAEPVTLEEIKAHLRLPDDDEQDSLLAGFLVSARTYCEQFCSRTFPEKVLQVSLDRFPLDGGAIHLRYGPVQLVVSITYVDASGNEQTLDSSVYQVDTASHSPRIHPAYQQSWPSIRHQMGAVVIQYAAGYSSVPEGVKTAIRLLVGGMWEQREGLTEKPLTANPAVEMLLTPYRAFGG